MNNTGKQIAYWINSASEDIATARILIEKNRLLHGLFFCHLVIEKALKAHIVKKTSEIAPRSHNLYYLLERAGLQVTTDEEIFLGVLMNYQLKGRYPDFNPSVPDQVVVNEYLIHTEKLLLWLTEKL